MKIVNSIVTFVLALDVASSMLGRTLDVLGFGLALTVLCLAIRLFG